MKPASRVAFGLLGISLLAAGFAIGFSLGKDPRVPPFGSVPSTIATDRSGVQVPRYTAEKKLPALAVTTVQVTSAATESLSEPVTTTSIVEEPATSSVEEKKEEKTPVKAPSPTPAPPEPEITVGEEEQK